MIGKLPINFWCLFLMNRLLILNLYYAPESFGGATIVAEETTRRLQDNHDWSVLVVTTMRDHSLPAFFLKRYKVKGVNVVAINLPFDAQGEDMFRSPAVAKCVLEIARAFKPDVCHCHAIQIIGCDFFESFVNDGIKLAITLHDCWWICERQFMINSDELYCNQWTIDPAQCSYCTSDTSMMHKREAYLRERLEQADLLLYPSEFHKRLHLANGFNEKISRVNKNGVTMPLAGYSKKRAEHKRRRNQVVFGFTGGPGLMKGSGQIIEAFNRIERTDYTLKLVDAAANVGTSWKDTNYWKIPGRMEFVPPYSQETMDDFFASIDILLFPSRWKESFGLTVREALVRDVWVIASDAGGVAEDLEDGINANVIPFGSGVEELQSAIEKSLDLSQWRSYKNPHFADIRGFNEQSQEISHYLSALI